METYLVEYNPHHVSGVGGKCLNLTLFVEESIDELCPCNEILKEAKLVRTERTEVPVDLPESLAVSILQGAISTIDVFLQHYKEGKDGRSFRYIKKSELKRVDKAKFDRRKIIEEAAEQLEWILSDDKPTELGVTFREICDAQCCDPEYTRKLVLETLFGEVHRNALETLKTYLDWKEDLDADSCCKRSFDTPYWKL